MEGRGELGGGGLDGGWACGLQRSAERDERVGAGSVDLVRLGKKEKVTLKLSASEAAREACLRIAVGSRGESQET